MTRKTKEDALITRQKILDAALHEFSIHGVSATTLSDISAAAGVSRGAFYWHFTNKAHLINELFFQFELYKSQYIKSFYRRLKSDPLSALREGLVSILFTIAHDTRQQEIMCLVFCKREVNQGNHIANDIRKNLYFNHDEIEQTLKKCVVLEKIPVETDAKKTTNIIVALMTGLIESWLLDQQAFNLCHDGNTLIDCFMHVLIMKEPCVCKSQ